MADAVRVMTWAGGWGKALRSAVSQSFGEATGLGVEHVEHVGLELPEPLVRALREGRVPPFDVVWSNAVPALQLARAGVTEPLDGLPCLAELHPRAQPPPCGPNARGAWPLVCAYVVFYVLVYRRELYPDGPPESWSALLDPRHRGRVALYPGGNGLYPIAQVMGGGSVADIPERMDPCWAFVRRLREQVGRLDYSIGMGQRIAARELDLCFRALTNALAFRADGLDVEFATPREGITDTLDCLWIPAGLGRARVEAARKYIAHAMSAQVQTVWCDALGALPLNRLARIPELVRRHPGLPDAPDEAHAPARVLRVPEALKADHQDAWVKRFELEMAPETSPRAFAP